MIAFKYENGGVFYCQAFSLFWLAFSSSSYGGLSHSSAVARSRNCRPMIPNRRSRKPTVANRSSRGLLWQKLRTGLVNLYQAKRLLEEFWWVDIFHSRFNAAYVMPLLIVDSWRSVDDRCSTLKVLTSSYWFCRRLGRLSTHAARHPRSCIIEI